MRVIVAGGPDYDGGAISIEEVVKNSGLNVATVLSGGERGAGLAVERWAEAKGVELEVYLSDWKRHKYRASHVRNEEMAKDADAMIALWDGKNPTISHLMSLMEAKKKPVYIHWRWRGK